MKKLFCLFIALFVFVHVISAEDASTPGTLKKELPTLHCLGVRWSIKGDQNKNAVITVQYRKKGDADWRDGFPLFRTMPNPHGSNRSKPHTVSGGWMFAGSIVDLEPDTEYEMKCSLKDPDGGEAEKTVSMKTWKEPVQPEKINILHVVPGSGGGAGTEKDPIKGLAHTQNIAKPGTLFLLHKGTYGGMGVKKSGKHGKPIIYRAAGDGDVILDGKKGRHLINAYKKDHIWLEDLTLTGAGYAIAANLCSNWLIRRCHFSKMTKGFNAEKGGEGRSRHHFITDNVFIGPTKWPRTRGIESFSAIKMSGAGHVVAYNIFQNLGDGIHGTGHGNMSASDYHNNDISICTDDGMETDYANFNIRVFNNRILNVAHGITAQPCKGGPVYIYRNFLYNVHPGFSPFKLNNHTTGVLIFHNTSFKKGSAFNIKPASETVTNIFTRNNLFIGKGGKGLDVGTPNMRHCDFDNDGYGGYGSFARWNRSHNYKTMEDAKKAGKIYSKYGAIKVDPKTCFNSGLMVSDDPNKAFKGAEVDGRLSKNSDAIDKGVPLPGFNDSFTGKAPDLGCYEYGKSAPHYGPRPKDFSLRDEILKYSSASSTSGSAGKKAIADKTTDKAPVKKLSPEESTAKKTEAYVKSRLSLAKTYIANKRNKKAREILEKLIEKHPEHVMIGDAKEMLNGLK